MVFRAFRSAEVQKNASEFSHGLDLSKYGIVIERWSSQMIDYKGLLARFKKNKKSNYLAQFT